MKNRVKQLHEQNPMLGHRGCRLSVTYPGDSDRHADHGHRRSRLQRREEEDAQGPARDHGSAGGHQAAELDFLQTQIIRETADAIIKARKSKVNTWSAR
jgi:hypothetical protein